MCLPAIFPFSSITEQTKNTAEVDSYGAPLADPESLTSYQSTPKPQYQATPQSHYQSESTTKATVSSSSILDAYGTPESTSSTSNYKVPSETQNSENYLSSTQSGAVGEFSKFPGPDFWTSIGLKPNLELDFDKIKSKLKKNLVSKDIK